MSVITKVPEPNIWEEICKDFASRKPPFKDEDSESVHTELHNFDPSVHTPVFYGRMHKKISIDADPMVDFDPTVGHPAGCGFAFVDRPPRTPSPTPPPPPDYKKCLPRAYLEHYVFPTLLPALEGMLKQAEEGKCFERKRTKFNAIDFLTEYLYKNNPKGEGRSGMGLLDIEFVQEWLKEHPRPPLPLSLLWSDEEAVLVIQSHWRGYLVRREPEVQELRQWQREWKEENGNIKNKVDDFWAKQMPNGDQPTPNASEDTIPDDNRDILVVSPTKQP